MKASTVVWTFNYYMNASVIDDGDHLNRALGAIYDDPNAIYEYAAQLNNTPTYDMDEAQLNEHRELQLQTANVINYMIGNPIPEDEQAAS